jgi:hypothetical protein
VKRVQLIVTGEMEKCALHSSLRVLFPETEFLPPHMAGSFTSCRLTAEPARGPEKGLPTKPAVNKLANALISYVEPGSQRAGHLDLVMAVDDLELCNVDQPGVVIERFARAVREELAARRLNGDSQRRVEDKLRARCSFHLFSPMTEAYFFGESAALSRAEAKRRSSFDPNTTDVEHFHVTDPDYTNTADGLRPWAKQRREAHPKQYLSFLCTPSGDPFSEKNDIQHYRETKQGKAALEALDWRAVLARPKHGLFARSMIHDIADALGIEAPASGDCASETEQGQAILLRNL